MSRPYSPVVAAALAAILATGAFALCAGNVRWHARDACFGPGCEVAPQVHKPLGLIDL